MLAYLLGHFGKMSVAVRVKKVTLSESDRPSCCHSLQVDYKSLAPCLQLQSVPAYATQQSLSSAMQKHSLFLNKNNIFLAEASSSIVWIGTIILQHAWLET